MKSKVNGIFSRSKKDKTPSLYLDIKNLPKKEKITLQDFFTEQNFVHYSKDKMEFKIGNLYYRYQAQNVCDFNFIVHYINKSTNVQMPFIEINSLKGILTPQDFGFSPPGLNVEFKDNRRRRDLALKTHAHGLAKVLSQLANGKTLENISETDRHTFDKHYRALTFKKGPCAELYVISDEELSKMSTTEIDTHITRKYAHLPLSEQKESYLKFLQDNIEKFSNQQRKALLFDILASQKHFLKKERHYRFYAPSHSNETFSMHQLVKILLQCKSDENLKRHMHINRMLEPIVIVADEDDKSEKKEIYMLSRHVS